MKRFFAPLLILLGGIGNLLLSSCDRPAPPDYDESQSTRLVALCHTLRNNQTSQAIALLKNTGNSEEQRLLEILTEQEQDRVLLVKANALLQSGDYAGLSQLISEAEKQGIASRELLQYRAAPQALQALQLFCSRMPWESPVDLDNAMNWLKPYLPALEQAPAFTAFWQSQLDQRDRLIRDRKIQQQTELLSKIDKFLGLQQLPAAWDSVSALYKLNPDHPLFSLIDLEKRSFVQLRNENAGQAESELALALTENTLSARQCAEAKEALFDRGQRTAETLAGAILYAQFASTMRGYLIALQRWQAVPDFQNQVPWFLNQGLARLFPKAEEFNARCWRTPSPGITELFAQLNQIAINYIQTNKESNP